MNAVKDGPVRTRGVSSLVLTERDLALLTGLWEFGAMTRDQIHALFFQGSALRRVNRRLKALADAGMIAPVSTSAASLAMYLPARDGAGTASWQDRSRAPGAQRVYRLAPGGAAPVSFRAGVDAAPVRHQAAKDSREHLAHALAIVDARIAFQRALQDRRFNTAPDSASAELLAFRGEAPIRHSYEYREAEGAGGREAVWRKEIFKPDALAVLRCGRNVSADDTRTFHLFFEIDLSSVASAEIRHKLRIAARYRREPGLFARRYASAGGNGGAADAGDCFHLILTTSAVRAANLAAIAAEERIDSVRVTTFAAFLGREARSANDAGPASGPLSPIWHVPGRDRLAGLPLFDEERKENP